MTKKIYSIEDIRRILKKSLSDTKVNKAILFGSYAKGNANESSDIDLLVDSDGTIIGLEFFGILQTLAESFKKQNHLKKKLI